MARKIIIGTLIDTPTLGAVRIVHNQRLEINEDGYIASISEWTGHSAQPDGVEIIELPSGSFMLPSFCDLHLHAPQFLYQGTGLHLPLMKWLEQYAFKAEERIDSDPSLAKKTYTTLAKRLKEHGTGAVLLFGTIKKETNMILAEIMQAAGIRAFVGKLSMDISSRKTYVEDSADQSLDAAKSFIGEVRSCFAHLPKERQLIEPVLTPRFVPTCSDKLLSGLGSLSEIENARLQSHLAEARDQVDWVETERGMSDIDVFDSHKLLTPRTVQAHCTFLTPTCFNRLSSRGTGIAHCPLSNAYFSSRPFKLRESLDAGVKVGLGTDVAGGYSIDIMNAMRSAVIVSRMREGTIKEAISTGNINCAQPANVSINWKEALYLATRGGAVTLGLPAGSGMFVVGAPFDAQLINLYEGEPIKAIGSLDFIDCNSAISLNEEMLEKWWCIGDTRNRSGLWVQGQRCFP